MHITIELPDQDPQPGMKGSVNIAAARRNGEIPKRAANDIAKLDIVARRAEIEAKFDLQSFVEIAFPNGQWDRRPDGPVYRGGNIFANVATSEWIDFDDAECWSARGVVELIAHMKGVDIDEATEIAERLYPVLAPNHIAHDGESYVQWPTFSKAA